MSFPKILQDFFYEGRMQFVGPTAVTDEERGEAVRVLAAFEADYRLDFPNDPPEFDPRVAVWAGELFFNAAMALTYREIDEAGINELLVIPFPGSNNAKSHYASDLTFRFLPDLFSRAQSASGSDPLLHHLKQWAETWPLSSVGMRDVAVKSVTGILESASLTGMYLDRIVATKDWGRLDHPLLKNLARASYGIHEELCPELFEMFSKESNDEQKAIS